MKKWFVAAAALVIFGIPAAYGAATPSKEKPKPTTTAQAQSADDNPAKACKAERKSSGVEAFGKRYGTNHNLRNAFGKCVSGRSKVDKDAKDEKDEDGDKGEKSGGAAKKCKAERAKDPAAFKTSYGTNANKANAFGKCVSKLAKAQSSS
jgi:hypothetical protein